MKTDYSELKPYIIKAKNGDIESLKFILKKTEKEIGAILYCISENKTEISDITQEVLLKIATKINNLKDITQFKPWVNKIALREYYNYQRKNKKHHNNKLIENIFEIENIRDEKSEPIKNCINNEIIKEIKNSLKKLQDTQKIAIIMREFEGLSYEEIAKLTNTNIGTVKSRISRARSQLKEHLNKIME